MNPFSALTAHRPFILLSNTEEVALVANLGKISLAKGTARSNNVFLPKLPITLLKVLPKSPPN